jgi:hypothetical protein
VTHLPNKAVHAHAREAPATSTERASPGRQPPGEAAKRQRRADNARYQRESRARKDQKRVPVHLAPVKANLIWSLRARKLVRADGAPTEKGTTFQRLAGILLDELLMRDRDRLSAADVSDGGEAVQGLTDDL